MKPRKWVVVLVSVIFILYTFLYGVKLRIQNDKHFSEIVSSYVTESLGVDVSVNNISIGFFSATISGFSVDLPYDNININIDKIRLAFSLRNFIMSKGDPASVISSLVLVNPKMVLKIPDYTKKHDEERTNLSSEKTPYIGLNYLLLKNASFTLKNRWGGDVFSVRKLNGKITPQGLDRKFSLSGELASNRKNIFIEGSFRPDFKGTHVSLRLNETDVKENISWRNFRITKGKVEGALEFALLNKKYPENIDANGWVKIKNGRGSFGKKSIVSGTNAVFKFKGNEFFIDTFTTKINKLRITAVGKTGYALDQFSDFTLTLDPTLALKSVKLSPHIQAPKKLDIHLFRTSGKKNFNVSFKTGNFLFLKKKSILKGSGILDGESFFLNEVVLKNDDINSKLSGVINYRTEPILYSLELNTEGASSVGKIGFDGLSSKINFDGIGELFSATANLTFANLYFDSVNAGSFSCNVSSDGSSLDIGLENGDEFFLSCTVDSFMNKPEFNGELVASDRTVNRFLKKYIPSMFPYATTNSIKITGKMLGNNITLNSDILFKGKNDSGKLKVNLERKSNKTAFNFSIKSDSLFFNSVEIPFNATGSIDSGTAIIDKCKLLGSIYLSGKIDSLKYVNLDLAVRDLSLENYLDTASFFKGGILKARAHMRGSVSNPFINYTVNLSDLKFDFIDSISAAFTGRYFNDTLIVLPFSFKRKTETIVELDTLTKCNSFFSLAGKIGNFDLSKIAIYGKSGNLKGKINCEFRSQLSGLPVNISLKSKKLEFPGYIITDVYANAGIRKDRIVLKNMAFKEKNISGELSAVLPNDFIISKPEPNDSLCIGFKAKGDLLAFVGEHFESPVSGHGYGTVEVNAVYSDDEWYFYKSAMNIKKGILVVDPYVPSDVKNFYLNANIDSLSRLNFDLGGMIKRKFITIYNDHNIPTGYEKIMAGNLDCGVIKSKTPDGGVLLNITGFQDNNDQINVEFLPKSGINTFMISGPIDKTRISGTWVLSNGEFTFPLLSNMPVYDFDPFPYITWDLDIKVGNRNVYYYYNVGGKKRRPIRFVEAQLDPATTFIGVRGRDADGTFRVIGGIRSYKGYVFYGMNFNRNFDVGVDFAPFIPKGANSYDNLPVVWGSVEAIADTSRFDRIKLTLFTKDETTGEYVKKGRYNDIQFRISSNFDKSPGLAERDFYKNAGLNIVTVKGVAGYVSSFGDQYINNYLFRRIENRLSKSIGIDVIRFESSIASNYLNFIYENNFNAVADKLYYLTFANVGLTVGRYFFKDRVFLKWRTELVPNEFNLVPEHNIGLEYQPIKYLWMDFNYGFYKNSSTGLYQQDPKFRIQFRMPLNKIKGLVGKE